MPDTVEVRQPKVTLEGEATDSIAISWTIPVSGGMAGSPYAKYSVHKSGGTTAENPTADELIQKVADAQRQMFEPPEEKTVTVFDGKEQVEFIGYDTGPHHSIAYGGVDNGRTIVHRCAKLDFINTAIYIGKSGSAIHKGEEENLTATTIAGLMREVLENIISNYESYVGDSDADLDPTAKAVRDIVHSSNKELIASEWYPILDASTKVTLDGLEDFLQNSTNAYAIANAIASIYLSSSADFFAKVSQFESMFQMRFVPDPTGKKSGKFISYKNLVSDPEEKTVGVRSLSIAAGPRSFLPVTGIVMTGLPGKDVHKGKDDTAGTSVCSWPEELPDGGSIVTITAPNWIPSESLPDRNDSDITGDSLEVEETSAYLSTLDADGKAVYESIQSLCKDFSRAVYCNTALGSSQASIATLLDVTWEVGKRYTVTQDGGSKLFDGFLCGLEHRVTSTPDRVEASTSLTFSHVEAGDFELPNK